MEMEKNMEKKPIAKMTVFFVITTILAAACSVALVIKNKNITKEMNAQEQNNEKTVEALQREIEDSDGIKDRIKESLEQGETPLNMLRNIYSDDVVYNYDGKYYFVPIIDNIPKSKLNPGDFKFNDDGELEYLKNGKAVSHKGIDVSKYQGNIDWEAVAEDGVEFAIIRLGYRGYGTGAIQLDESFETNMEGALKAGIDVGVYFFSQAISEKEAEEEANFVIENIKPYKITCPVVFDTEEVAGEEGRMKEISSDKLTDISIKFLDTVEEEGYTPMIYANLKWYIANLDIERLVDYEKWFASYTTPYYFPYEISMWQYTDQGKVNGIEGSVDMNISFKEWGKKESSKTNI